jgi:hypothetical protein
MAKFYSAGTSGRSSGGMSLTWINGREIQKRMEQISDGLAWDDTGKLISRKTAANREMRTAAKDIAANILIPQMKRTARTAPDKIARAMAETARPMSDRIVAVRVGGVNPPLRGFKRGVGRRRSKGVMSTGRDSTSRNWRTTLAWGSEFGPWPGGRAMTKSGARGALVNHYRVPRNYPRGYWVLPAVDDVKVKAAARFGEAIDDVINKYTGGWR